MCKYCEDKKHFPTKFPNEIDLFIKKNKLKIIYDIGDPYDNVNTEAVINYCPYCGRKL